MSTRREARHAKQQLREQLAALRDESKVQLHLLSLDAKQRWSELEEQIKTLEIEAQQDCENATGTLRKTANQLTLAVREFMTKHMDRSSGPRL